MLICSGFSEDEKTASAEARKTVVYDEDCPETPQERALSLVKPVNISVCRFLFMCRPVQRKYAAEAAYRPRGFIT